MTWLRVWHALVYIGDGAVLVPCAALLFAWLIAPPATRRAGWWWLCAVIVVSGGVALTKGLYMVSGWRPAGMNFIGLSGHAALSFLFWPSAAALVTAPDRPRLRVAAIALGAALALAISAASWVLHDHSLSELILGGLWGAAGAAGFLRLAWPQVADVPLARNALVIGLALLALVTFGHKFPSEKVLGWIALRMDGGTALHTRTDLGSKAHFMNEEASARQPDQRERRTRMQR